MLASTLPLNGGFARMREYFSASSLSSDTLSLYSIWGSSIPCAIMFIAPIRSIVRSVSYPVNMSLLK